MGFPSSLGPALSDAAARASVYVEDNSTAVAVAGGLTALGAITYFATRKPRDGYKVAPTSFQLGVGSLKGNDVKNEVRSGDDPVTGWPMFLLVCACWPGS